MNRLKNIIALSVGTALLGGTLAFADKPDSPGNSGNNKNKSKQLDSSTDYHRLSYFTDDRMRLIDNYYRQQRTSGHCPPGLAKKNNGCQPPGQAKKWARGKPLPSDLAYYDLPRSLLRELGRIPDGEKVVRVGADLLLINIASKMVIDAAENLDDMF